jgi:hypothetical protein
LVVNTKFTSFLAVAFAATGLASAAPTDVGLSLRDRADLLQVAAAVRAAILRGDSAAFLRFVSTTQGLQCTDTIYRYDKVARFLRDKGSYLYMGLFDSEQFAAQCGEGYSPQYPATSDKSFFERSPKSSMEITFPSKGYAEVTYAPGAADLYPLKYQFHKEAHGWKLVGGIVIGDCTCG